MLIHLYMDEDAMGKGLVQPLRSNGVPVTTAQEVGMIKRPDEEHLAYASTQGYVLFSFNVRDYSDLHIRLLTQGRTHAGIIVVHQTRYSIGEQLRRILNLVTRKSAEEMRDQMEFLGSWG